MERSTETGNRIAFLDNLRTAMIFLVVLYHSGIVYESSGLFASFWVVDDPSTNDIVGIVNVVIDIFVIPVIFFVSGFLAPVALRHAAGRAFLAHRFKRLMMPWLIAVLTLMPAYKFLFLYSRQLPQEHWTTYFHFSNGALSQSWLWFLPILFLFDAVFWGLATAKIRPPDISLRTGVAAVFSLGVLYSFAISILGLTGWTKTFLFDFQNERLLPYFLVFLLGALCFKLRVFDLPPASRRLYIAVSATAWIPITVYLIVLLSLLFRPGQYFVSLTVDLVVLWCAFYLSLLSLLYLLIATFRFWLNTRGRLGEWLAASSYAVYVIHVPVLGAIALLMLDTEINSALKYIVLTACTYAVSNVLVHGYRQVLKPRLGFWTGAPHRNGSIPG
jgi:peptidoglycan/LPS O-acetylase OafA/YrhL